MKTAICYFSASGNGLDIATKLQKLIPKSTLIAIPAVENIEELMDFGRIVLISPVYYYGTPTNVKAFIGKLSVFPKKHYFAILHYGGFSGNALGLTNSLFVENGLVLSNAFKLTMPGDYVTAKSAESPRVKALLAKMPKKITKIAHTILLGKTRVVTNNFFSFTDKTHKKAAAKWAKFARGFTVADSCNHCGKCAEFCPQKNITMAAGKPAFGNNCISCLACYNRCPKAAINYSQKAVGKPRYVNPILK